MNEDGCPADEGDESCAGHVCPDGGEPARSVPRVTLLHLLEPRAARGVDPAQNYGVCRERDCPVLYFSSSGDARWTTDEVRVQVGFKRAADNPPHPVCYCFGYTEENIAREIDETGESTVVEWITERVRDDECACECKNPTGRCCLGDVQEAIPPR